MKATVKSVLLSSVFGFALVLSACSGGGSSSNPAPTPPPSGGGGGGGVTNPPPEPTGAFRDEVGTSRFMSQAAFGANMEEIDALTGTLASDWFVAQLGATPSLNLEKTLNAIAQGEEPGGGCQVCQVPTHLFWANAIEGEDQLRQRMAFALSQIVVTAHRDGSALFNLPSANAYYQDILVQNALGNYRELLQEVTYSPTMGIYLTYYQNQKGDAATGRVPDENYAREVMQLFSIGLLELNVDGTYKTDGSGNHIETYDNEDVTGLARVFTGFSLDHPNFFAGRGQVGVQEIAQPMVMFDEYHSTLEKSFLGVTIPPNTSGEQSVDMALDALVDHPNTPPFIARQLIQRFVTSHPDPAYVERVATAFADGTYTLPSDEVVGDGRRGDLTATIAAILFDDQAREADGFDNNHFGKLREPVLRFIHWARAFDASTVTPEYLRILNDTSRNSLLAQAPYKSPSVFNFYRPGYVAPGTETGETGLTMPEMQLVNAATIEGYSNFMTTFSFEGPANGGQTPEQQESFRPDYSDEIALADDVPTLIDRLDLLLTHGAMSAESKQTIIDIIENVDLNDPNGAETRVRIAVVLMMTAPDYIATQ